MGVKKISAILNAKFLQRKLYFWRLLSVILLLILISITSDFDKDISSNSEYIARVSIKGFINNDLYRIQKLEDLKRNKSIKAVIVDIDSPGGSVVGGEMLFEAINNLSKDLPIVAFVGSQATSAAYLAAIACDYIIAPKGSIVGSIGVILQSVDLTGLAERLGIDPIIIKSTDLKGVPHFAEGLTAEGEDSLREVISDIYEMFANLVLEERVIPEEYKEEVLSGKIFSGVQATKYGLVDKTGDMRAVRKFLRQNKVMDDIEIKDVSLQKNKTGSFLKIFAPLFNILSSYTGVLALR